MSESKYQRVCLEGEARVFPADIEKVARLHDYFNLEISFPDESSNIPLVKVKGRKSCS